MIWFWNFATRPLLEAAAPRVIVEVGSQAGKSTTNLLTFASSKGAILHVIDTVKGFDVDEYEQRYPGRMIFHQAMSLDAIPRIRDADVYLIDGDHNWYTVYHELKAIEKVAQEEERAFPLTLFHDVEWPYARRDMYYDPSNVPEEFRQPSKKGSLYPGKPGLQAKGMNRHLHHALVEGTPRNGVLTAIEDFIAESETELEFQKITGSSGLGLLVPRSTLDEQPILNAAWHHFASAEFLAEHCLRIEDARRRSRVDLMIMKREHAGLLKELESLRETAGAT